MILHSELKHQKKLVRSLRKKSLWAKNLEEVYEYKLFAIIMQLCIFRTVSKEAFGKMFSQSCSSFFVCGTISVHGQPALVKYSVNLQSMHKRTMISMCVHGVGVWMGLTIFR